MKWKIGMQAATEKRPDGVFTIINLTGQAAAQRATLRASEHGSRQFSVLISTLRRTLTAKSRARLVMMAARLDLTIYEMQEQYAMLHGSERQGRSWLLRDRAGKKPYVRKGYPAQRRRKSEGTAERIKDRLRRDCRVAGGVYRAIAVRGDALRGGGGAGELGV